MCIKYDADVVFGCILLCYSWLLGLTTTKKMSEGDNKQASDSAAQEVKTESAAPAGQTVSPPVSMVSHPPAAAATEDEEEESEDESEILEESPCGRWQKRREEVWDESEEGSCLPVLNIQRLNFHAQ